MRSTEDQAYELAEVIRRAKNEAATTGNLLSIYAGMGWKTCQGKAPEGKNTAVTVHPCGSVYAIMRDEMVRLAVHMAEGSK